MPVEAPRQTRDSRLHFIRREDQGTDMQLEKFGFRIRAHNGAVIDHITIQAADAGEARLRLMRMYPHCEVMDTWSESATPTPTAGKSFEDIADIINH
jgi:hypothetical protein